MCRCTGRNVAKGAFTTATKLLIWERDEGRCVVTGRPLSMESGTEVHHRLPRRSGGRKGEWARICASPANGVLLSVEGHRWVESDRYEAMRDGLLIPQGWLPTKTALKHAVHGLVHLDDLGGFTRLTTPF